MYTAEEYYALLKEKYMGDGDGALADYHAMRFAAAWDLLVNTIDVSGAAILDFGCGDGQFDEDLEAAGAVVSACDLSPDMVELARKRLGDVAVGGIDYLESIQGKKFDALIALNVLPYLTEEEEARFYQAANRLLRPGGAILVSHANELLDLTSCNRYSVETIKALAKTYLGDRADEAVSQYKSLLSFPDEPKPKPRGMETGVVNCSERDLLPKRRADPFSYGAQTAQRHGFAVRGFTPLRIFVVPPRVTESNSELFKLSNELHLSALPDTYKRLLCSQFQVVFSTDSQP